ncbi:MAG TPA: cation:proton antiporter [Candidatus Acidoferrum sp.]|nr:cation:proton antiporter [Candidatus Acidoferrum sp.]
MQADLFALLSLVIVIAVIVSAVMRFFRQPLIIGYILTGVVVGSSFLRLIPNGTSFKSFSDIGISLLLFIIGLGLNTQVIKRLGKVVLYTASVQIILSALAGFIAAKLIGFSSDEAFIIGIALSFSSTIIIIKLFTDKREQTRLYAQIALGILLMQDLVASIALVFLAASKNGDVSFGEIGLLAVKGAIVGAVLVFVSTKLLPRIERFVASSQEFLFLFALAWGFGIAMLFQTAGFSIEVGALFAGVALARLPYAQEVASRLKPLRDFFVVVFFIALGEGLDLRNLVAALVPALLFSAVVIFIKPLTALVTMGWLGHTKRTSFKAAISLAQVSEFSLVFVLLAQTGGLISGYVGTVITLTAIITIAVSTYLIQYDEQLFARFEHGLHFFERKVTQEEHHHLEAYPLVLLGYQKGGEQFVKSFKALRRRYVVVDYNPEVIEDLEAHHIPNLYGDVTDLELLQEIGIAKTRLIVSTITDHAINVGLVRHVIASNPNAIIICHSDDYKQAVELYHLGATYVMMPHLIGSEKISSFIKHAGLNREEFVEYRNEHLLLLEGKTSPSA